MLRRIKLRTLLDRVQAKLAFCICLTNQAYTRSASLLWREALEGSTTEQRLSFAKAKLETALIDISQLNKSALSKFLQSEEAMKLAVEPKSKLREHGDQAAHYGLTKPQFSAAVDEYCQNGGDNGNGLRVLIDFLFS